MVENFSLVDFLKGLVPQILQDLAGEAAGILVDAIVAIALPAAGLVKTLWNGLKWLWEQRTTVVELFNNVKDAFSALVQGDVKAVAKKVYESLTDLVLPIFHLIEKIPIIDKIIGLVKKGFATVTTAIGKIVDKVIAWLATLVQPFVATVKDFLAGIFGGDEGDEKDKPIVRRVAEELDKTADDDPDADYETVLNRMKERAVKLADEENKTLKPEKKRLQVVFSATEKGRADGYIDFTVIIAPNAARAKRRRSVPAKAIIPKDKFDAYLEEVEKFARSRKIGSNQRILLEQNRSTTKYGYLGKVKATLQRVAFKRKKDKLISEWETNTGTKWPTYRNSVPAQDPDSEQPFRKAGSYYDAHELIPNSYGGPQEWWNIHPAAAPTQHQAGIHGKGRLFQELFPHD